MKLEIGFGSCPQTVELPDETVLDLSLIHISLHLGCPAPWLRRFFHIL